MRETYRILAQGQKISNDSWTTGLNGNDILCGPSGAGKTRGYVIPNVLQCSESMIVADTKGALLGELGGVLKENGYQVLSVDFNDIGAASGSGYNPLDFIRGGHEQDIMTVASALIPIECEEPYWDHAAQTLLQALIGYTLECLPKEEHDLYTVTRLFLSGKCDSLFKELEAIDPEGFAVTRYRLARKNRVAEKMIASVEGMLAERLTMCSFAGVRKLFSNPNRISFPRLAEEKTALFLNISDTDRSMDRLVNLFYTQALQSLFNAADNSPGHRLKIPVRFYLDDFAANVMIPDFDKIISVIRSREISVSVIIQSISQLEAMYGKARASTILNNADHFIYLGGTDVDTAHYVAQRANKPVSAILGMPLDAALLFTRGQPPKAVKKYDLHSHPLYKRLPEYQAQPGADMEMGM
ncbi:MAG: type IV secretory system conjugative DNA transfer family protein [Bacteroidales bacterium]|nr:type IV secretory system conjugative DNA transfer family protein [Bacteroidales bacterium]